MLISWIFSGGKHEVCIEDEKRDEWYVIDGLVLEKIVVFVEDEEDECFDDEVDEEASEGTGFCLQLGFPATLELLVGAHIINMAEFRHTLSNRICSHYEICASMRLA